LKKPEKNRAKLKKSSRNRAKLEKPSQNRSKLKKQSQTKKTEPNRFEPVFALKNQTKTGRFEPSLAGPIPSLFFAYARPGHRPRLAWSRVGLVPG